MEISRRSLISGAGAALIVSGLAARPGVAAEPELSLVVDGNPQGTVVLDTDADDQVAHAADQLIAYIARATGATLPLVRVSVAGGAALPSGPAVVVGAIAGEAGIDPGEVAALGQDSYLIRRSGKLLTIVGSDGWGTRFGVYEFLERYLDVRWLMPDDVLTGQENTGSVVPSTTELSLDAVDVGDAPAFIDRELNPFPIASDPESVNWDWVPAASWIDDQMKSWGRYARVRRTLDFQHNMWDVVPVSVYGDPAKPDTYHPEFFPIRNGETQIPSPTQKTGWQPRFSAPGIGAAAAGRIAEFLRANPGVSSYSLAVNDGHGYSEDEEVPGTGRFLGELSVSESYYAFVNEVADRLTAEFPDLRLCLLAYNQVASPPTFPVHPSVIPMLVANTYLWLAPGVAEQDKQWAEQWQSVAAAIGWWDRVYGGRFTLPRPEVRRLAETVRYFRDVDVTGVMSEWSPGWGEGPKGWLYTKLLWNPDRDPDRLLHDWCCHAAGRRAAPHLTAYFRLWDHIWLDLVPQSEWMARGDFFTADYLVAVPNDLVVEAEQHLARAEAATRTAEEAGRVSVLRRWFQYYWASAMSFPRPTTAPTSASEATVLLETAAGELDRDLGLATGRSILIADLGYPRRWRGPEAFGVSWSGWNHYTTWDLADYLAAHEPAESGGPVRDLVTTMQQTATSPYVKHLADLVLSLADDGTVERLTNPGFETGERAPWGLIARPEDAARVQVVDSPVHTGDKALRLPDWWAGQVAQRIQVQPGFFRFSAWIRVDEGTDKVPHGPYAKLQTRLLGADGNKLRDIVRAFSLDPAASQWHELVQTDMIDHGVAQVEVWVLVDTQFPLYVDSVSFQQPAAPIAIEPWRNETFDDLEIGSAPDGWVTTDPGALTIQPNSDGGHLLSVRSSQPHLDRASLTRWFGAFDGDLQISFRIRRAVELRSLDIRLEEPQSRTAQLRVRMINGVFLHRGDGAWINSGARYTPGEFSEVTIAVHATSGSYDLVVDGVVVGTSQTLASAGAPGKLWLSANGLVAPGAENYALDSFAILPPAP